MKKIIYTLLACCFLAACKKESTATKSMQQPTEEPPKAENTLAKLKFDNPKDVYCNMDIDGNVADTMKYQGKLYGFCSSYCKDEFKKDPEKYLAKK